MSSPNVVVVDGDGDVEMQESNTQRIVPVERSLLKPKYLSENHRFLLQKIIQKGFMKVEEVKNFLQKILEVEKYNEFERTNYQNIVAPRFEIDFFVAEEEDNISAEEVDAFIKSINNSLMKFSFRIVKKKHHDILYYGISNQMEDEMSKISSNFEDVELEFFNRVVGLIKESRGENEDVSTVTKNDCFQERGKLKSNRVEIVLEKLVKQKWLEINKDMIVDFGIMSKLDLKVTE